MAVPTRDSLLIPWGSNFDVKVTLSPPTYSLVAAQATAFHAAYTPYVTAYNAMMSARAAGTQSKVLTSTTASAKLTLLKIARELYAIVQSSNAVSPANKEDVGVVVRKVHPTPIPVPGEAPGIAVIATVGNTVKIRLFDVTDPTRRRRPPGTDGASVFSFVGAAAPTEESGWNFEGNSGVSDVSITFPSGTPAGAKVWFTAAWFNGRKQRGPAASPVGTNMPGGAAMAA